MVVVVLVLGFNNFFVGLEVELGGDGLVLYLHRQSLFSLPYV